jgi:hypothetical protein
LFTAIALIAVNGAFRASRFLGAETASVQAEAGIFQEGFAFGTKAIVVLVATVDAHHGRERFEFAREAFVDKARRRRM